MQNLMIENALVIAIKLSTKEKADALKAWAIAHGYDITKVPGYQE